MHGDGSHVKDAKLPSEHAAVELLAMYPAAQFTVPDSDSAMRANPLLQMPSACALITESMVHGDGSHVKDARLHNKHAALALLAVYPAAHSAVHDSESNNARHPAAANACSMSVAGGTSHIPDLD